MFGVFGRDSKVVEYATYMSTLRSDRGMINLRL